MTTSGYPEHGIIAPLITVPAKESLDFRIESILKAGDTYAVLSIRDRRLAGLFPGFSVEQLALALSVYADLARDRWHVEHCDNHSKYYFYRRPEGRPRDACTRIDPSDFPRVRAYLGDRLMANVLVHLSRETFEYAGVSFKTKVKWTWLMLHVFFSLNGEYVVTGKKREAATGRSPAGP